MVDSPFQLVQDFFHEPYIHICWLVSTHLKNIKHFYFPQVSECTISFQTNVQETTYVIKEKTSVEKLKYFCLLTWLTYPLWCYFKKEKTTPPPRKKKHPNKTSFHTQLDPKLPPPPKKKNIPPNKIHTQLDPQEKIPLKPRCLPKDSAKSRSPGPSLKLQAAFKHPRVLPKTKIRNTSFGNKSFKERFKTSDIILYMHFLSSNFFLVSKSKFDDLLVISSFVGLKSTQAKNSKTNHYSNHHFLFTESRVFSGNFRLLRHQWVSRQQQNQSLNLVPLMPVISPRWSGAPDAG